MRYQSCPGTGGSRVFDPGSGPSGPPPVERAARLANFQIDHLHMVSARVGWAVDGVTGDPLHTVGNADSWEVVDPPGSPPTGYLSVPAFFAMKLRRRAPGECPYQQASRSDRGHRRRSRTHIPIQRRRSGHGYLGMAEASAGKHALLRHLWGARPEDGERAIAPATALSSRHRESATCSGAARALKTPPRRH